MSDGEQAPLGHEAQLVKANRWVQIGHTLLVNQSIEEVVDRRNGNANGRIRDSIRGVEVSEMNQ